MYWKPVLLLLLLGSLSTVAQNTTRSPQNVEICKSEKAKWCSAGAETVYVSFYLNKTLHLNNLIVNLCNDLEVKGCESTDLECSGRDMRDFFHACGQAHFQVAEKVLSEPVSEHCRRSLKMSGQYEVIQELVNQLREPRMDINFNCNLLNDLSVLNTGLKTVRNWCGGDEILKFYEFVYKAKALYFCNDKNIIFQQCEQVGFGFVTQFVKGTFDQQTTM